MNHLSVAKLLTVVLLYGFSSFLYAKDNLFVFVFKNGVAQKNITIKVGENSGETNEFGLANFDLPGDFYEIGYFENREMFAITEVNLIEQLQSQVFLNLTNSGAEAELDLPLASYSKEFEQAEIKQQTGPKGMLALTVLDYETGNPVPGVKLFFKGYAVEGQSDEKGLASLELSQGSYDISLVHPKYVMQVIKDIRIDADKTTSDSLKITQSDIVLDEFVVSAPFVEGSLASTFADMKDNTVLGEAISAEQFSKSGDSSASGALKRVTAITVVDDKFVFVRGLGERYSTILLNGLEVPSPEPTKRVVPLDIFPTGVIQSMDIQKTYSSDLPGTFAGGTVSIKTKDIPKEDNFIKGTVGISFDNSTGDEGVYNPDNREELPGIILDLSENFSVLTREVRIGSTVLAEGLSASEKLALNEAMVNYRQYGLEERKIKPGSSVSGTLGQSFRTRSGLKYGIAGTMYYKTDEDFVEIKQDEYQFETGSGTIIHTEDNRFEVTRVSEKFGGLMSVGLETLNNQKFKYTLLALSELEDLTSKGLENELIEGRVQERTFLQYTEKQLFSHQLNGDHQLGKDGGKVFDDVNITWGFAVAEATRLEPGTFEYEYKEASDQFVVDAKKLFYLYSDLEDEVDNFRLDFSLPFLFRKLEAETRVGIFQYDKERRLDNRRFKIKYDQVLDSSPIDEALSEDNVDNGTLDVLDSYKPDDFYTAQQEITAFYVNQILNPTKQINLNFGFRAEDSTQELQVGEEQEVSKLETDNTLPFVNATYKLSDEHQFRFGYSKSLSRPDFREFSPNRFKDPLTGNIIFGFDELRSTEITNLDLKYEWFPSFDEFFSIGLFTKEFVDPIETVRTVNDVDIEISFRNAQSADSIGIEVGFRKKLDGFFPKLKLNLENYFISGNYAYIDSEIELNKSAPENANDQFIPFLTSEKRSMQGQSPYVLNLNFGYDNFHTRTSAIFLFNVYGERISSLGINGNPDLYEQPFRRLDFVLKWGINDTYDEQRKKIGYTLTFKAKNLLDSEITEEQGSEETLSYKPGRSFDLSFSMNY